MFMFIQKGGLNKSEIMIAMRKNKNDKNKSKNQD